MAETNNSGFSLWEWVKRAIALMVFINIFSAFIPKAKKMWMHQTSQSTNVALIDIKGTIMYSSRWLKELRYAQKDPSVKGIVLRVNSGGGAPGASELLHREIVRIKADKPVVALIENMCASGAYWIASAADKIIAQNTSAVGSVGVVASMLKFKTLVEKHGVEVENYQSGEYKTAGSPWSDKSSDKLIKYCQKSCDDIYHSFVESVAKARGLDVSKHKNWANGKVFSGDQAYNEGLVDVLGDMTSCEEMIKELAHLPADSKVDFVRYPQPTRLAQILGGQDDDLDDDLDGFGSSVMHNLLNWFQNKLSIEAANQPPAML